MSLPTKLASMAEAFDQPNVFDEISSDFNDKKVNQKDESFSKVIL